jgi:hypothetical protein
MTHQLRLRAMTALLSAATVAGLAVTAPPAQATSTYTTQSVTVTRSPDPAPQLTGVRTGRHATFDRVVFDLSGQPSGYHVGYVKVVRADGSGKVISMRGNYYLLVRLTPAVAHDDSGTATYNGPHKFWVGYPQLRQVAFAGDFEGTVSFGLGLRHRNGFRVFTLHDPTRIVVDVRH